MTSPKMKSKLEYCVLKRKNRNRDICAITIILIPCCLCVTWIGGSLGVMAGVSRGVYVLCTVLFG